MQCPSCRLPNKDSAIHCQLCGAALRDGSRFTPTAAEPRYTPISSPQPGPPLYPPAPPQFQSSSPGQHGAYNGQQKFCSQCGTSVSIYAQQCPYCHHGFVQPNYAPTIPIAQLYPPMVPQLAPAQVLKKPGKVQAIAIMCLVDGILNVSWGIFLIAMICTAPLGIYALILAIFEIIFAIKILPELPVAHGPNKTLAIMQIVCIITGDVISLVIGIISLSFYNDPEVQAYYMAMNRPY